MSGFPISCAPSANRTTASLAVSGFSSDEIATTTSMSGELPTRDSTRACAAGPAPPAVMSTGLRVPA